jgi:predicted membrane protein
MDTHPLSGPVRLLFRSGLVIFLVTIVIGILNGIDVWDPTREMLLTHVHAGTIGWITVAVIGVALLMFGEDSGPDDVRSATRLAQAVVGATVIYVIAFATTTGIFRPIAGTLMLVVVVWAFLWVTARRRRTEPTVASLGLYLALVSLVLGAILGVLLGLFIAEGEVPGLDTETASNVGAAHPAAMLAGYLLLAGIAIAEWRLSDRPALQSESRSGVAVAWGLFVAGILFNLALILDQEALIQVASLLQVVSIVGFAVRMRSHLVPSAWRGAGVSLYAKFSVVYLVLGVALLVYVVQLFVSGELDPETGEGPVGVLIAFDHAMFLGVMTNALFAGLAIGLAYDAAQRLVVWGVNIGVAGFIVGLVSDQAVLKRIFTPLLGVALVTAVVVFLRPRGAPASA